MFKEDDSLIRDFIDGSDLLKKVQTAYHSGELVQIYFYQINKAYMLEYNIKVEICRNGDKLSFVQGGLKNNNNKVLFTFTIDFESLGYIEYQLVSGVNFLFFNALYNHSISKEKKNNMYVDCIDFIQQFVYNFISGRSTILDVALYQDRESSLGREFFNLSDKNTDESCEDFTTNYYHFKNNCNKALGLLDKNSIKLRIKYIEYTLANLLAVGDSCFSVKTRIVDATDSDFNFYFNKLFGQRWLRIDTDWTGDDYDD